MEYLNSVKKVPVELIPEIIKEYNSGKSINKLVQIFNSTPKVLAEILKSNGVKIRLSTLTEKKQIKFTLKRSSIHKLQCYSNKENIPIDFLIERFIEKL